MEQVILLERSPPSLRHSHLMPVPIRKVSLDVTHHGGWQVQQGGNIAFHRQTSYRASCTSTLTAHNQQCMHVDACTVC